MVRYFKASLAHYEQIRAGMDAARDYVQDVTSDYGRALTVTSFPPAAEAPTDGTHYYLALHEWQYAGMPDAAAMLATYLGTIILEVTEAEYRAVASANSPYLN